MDFIALDVETANASLSSICQIGLAEFSNGKLINQANILVNPDSYFDPINIELHGIDESTVKDAKRFDFVGPKLFAALQGNKIVTHSSFDRTALKQAADLWGVDMPELLWIDSLKVARRAWPEVAHAGYSLKKLAARFDIEFRHHDAAEDARAAGLIILKAIDNTGLSIDDWAIRVKQPLSGVVSGGRINLTGNENGSLYGEKLVFTGKIMLVRKEAALLAANAGCDVSDNLNKETTILVVGDQDISHLGGHDKSSKHRKAEALISKGQEIKIICEKDFLELIKSTEN